MPAISLNTVNPILLMSLVSLFLATTAGTDFCVVMQYCEHKCSSSPYL